MHEITLSGPGRNALGSEMMAYILDELEKAAGKPILLSGGGETFSAGLNLLELSELDGPGMVHFLSRLEDTCAALYTYPGPTVAAVNGHAIAGGCVVALACDLRIAARDANIKIGLNEVALGLRFPPSVLEIIRRRVPAHHLDAVLLGGGLHDPEEALRLGLVDEVADDVHWRAREVLGTLAAHPAGAYAALKNDLRGASLEVDPAKRESFLQDGLSLWTSEAFRDKIRQVLKK